MKAVILLGGFGTRLRPLTCQIPKPLLPLANRPSLLYQLDLLKKYKVKEVTFCIGYLSKMFKEYFGDGRRFGMKINHVYERTPLGTGGGIKNAEKYMDETTVIFNGDILTDLDLGAMFRFHRKNKSKVTISLVRVKDPTIYGLIETDKSHRIRQFLEKPSWDQVTCNTINAGTYIFEPGIIDYIPPGINYSVERGLFPLLLKRKEPMYGFVANSYWLDIGTIEKYLQAHYDILRGKVKCSVVKRDKKVKISKTARVDKKTIIGAGTKIEPLVQLTGLNCIGKRCIIKKSAQIIDSVILDGSYIGEGVKIEKSAVGMNCKIEPHSVLRPGTALGGNSLIRRYSKL